MKSAGNPVNAYVTIDFMRFLAAFAVLWSHAWGMVVPPYSAGIVDAWRPVYWSAGFGANAVCVDCREAGTGRGVFEALE